MSKDINPIEAIKSRIFWHIAVASTLQAFVTITVIIHIMPYLNSVGVTRTAASLVASAIPISNIIGRLGFGWMGDRIDRKRAMIICYVLLSMGMLFLGVSGLLGTWFLVPFVLLFGFGWGGSVALRVPMLTGYFGRNRFGTIYGFVMGVLITGNIAGPPLAGWIYDNWGTYQWTWIAFATLTVASAIIISTIPPAKTIERAS